MKGKFLARAVVGNDLEGKPISGLKESKTKGTPEFFILFEVVEGDKKGERVPWDGWLTDGAKPRTLESLILCGLEGDDLSNPVGINKNVVQIDVDEEPDYQVEKKDAEGKLIGTEMRKGSSRVQWVNDPARSASVHKPMDEGTAKTFADKMKGDIMAARAKRSAPAAAGDGDRFDYGANEVGQLQRPQQTQVSPEAQQPGAKTGY